MTCFNINIRRAELKIYQGHFLLCVCLCVSLCICVCVSIYVSACVCVCVHVYIYVHKHSCHSAQYTCVEATGQSLISFPTFYLGLGSVSSAKCMYVVLPAMGFQGYYFLYHLPIFLWGTGSPHLIHFSSH